MFIVTERREGSRDFTCGVWLDGFATLQQASNACAENCVIGDDEELRVQQWDQHEWYLDVDLDEPEPMYVITEVTI